VVHGADDVLVPAGNARLLADATPAAELQVWDHAGHLYVSDEPRADREVARFLLRHTPELRGARRLLARARRAMALGAGAGAGDAR